MRKLNKREIDLLAECMKDKAPNDLWMVDNIYSLTNEQYNYLREVICDSLIIEGFDKGEITSYGVRLEELIDIIGNMIIDE